MKRVQIVLSPPESKRLLCQALLEYGPVKNALSNGIVAVHPSSSTYHLYSILVGRRPEGVWMAGMIIPRGTCIEGRCHAEFEADGYDDLSNPANFPYTWVFRAGQLDPEPIKLSDILAQIGKGDIYVKGVNAADAYGYTGVLMASLAGGTIGLTIKAAKKQKFDLICMAGLEKFIPGSIKEVAPETGRPITKDALGIPCGLLPIKRPAFSEITAFQELYGVKAIPVASGGVGGAEGSIMLVLKGEEDNLIRAMEGIKNIKGTPSPEVKIPDCKTCHSPGCLFAGQEIRW